tara:strand:+ start:4991 stop:5914 length:924 start_codon:yes stop_codon:yes gene_type:complete
LKKILITGGAGFIGANLISFLNNHSNNYKIDVIDNESLGKRSDIQGNIINYHCLDIKNSNSFDLLKCEYDTVIHLAASTRVIESIEKPSLMIDNNVIGTFRLLEYCRKKNIKKVVIASTGGAIIGEEPGLISELSRPNPISPYGASKLFIEALSNSYCVNYGMEIACLRFSNVYGPKSHRKESVIANFFKRIKNEQEIIIFGDGLQERDYIYVDDISKVILNCISKEITGVFQIATGKSTNINYIISCMKDIVGSDFNSKIKYHKKREGEVDKTKFDISKAKEFLNFESEVDINRGLKETWKWFLEN